MMIVVLKEKKKWKYDVKYMREAFHRIAKYLFHFHNRVL